MKKFIFSFLLLIILGCAGYLAFLYYWPYSKGNRSGELIKFSEKGVLVKTWEGELSQGIGEDRTFYFSVYRKDQDIIDDLNSYNGRYVTLTYEQHFAKFFWWGDTEYFITNVKLDSMAQGKYIAPINNN